MKKGFNRSKSLDRLKKDESEAMGNAKPGIAYERIEQRLAPFPKPVLILGLFCDSVVNMLVRDRPDLYAAPQEGLELKPDQNAAQLPIEKRVRLDVIRDVCFGQQKHCCGVLSPPAIEYLQKTDLNPIVIYLSPSSKAIVKIIKNKFAPNFDRRPQYLYDEAVGFERQHCHLFCASVPFTDNDGWYHSLQEAIATLQSQPQWYLMKDDVDDEDSANQNGVHDVSATKAQLNRSMIESRSTGAPSGMHSRLNRSMELIPDVGSKNTFVTPRSRGRAKSQGDTLADDSFGSGAGVKQPKKSILKVKNGSDSGSTSSTSGVTYETVRTSHHLVSSP